MSGERADPNPLQTRVIKNQLHCNFVSKQKKLPIFSRKEMEQNAGSTEIPKKSSFKWD